MASVRSDNLHGNSADEIGFLEGLCIELTIVVAAFDLAKATDHADRVDALRRTVEARRDALRGALPLPPRRDKAKPPPEPTAAEPVDDKSVTADVKRGRLVRLDLSRPLDVDPKRLAALRALARHPANRKRARR